MQVNRVMPGWDSLETVSWLHGSAQIVGLILLAALMGLAAFAAYNLRKSFWPEWLDIGEFQIRSRFVEIACAVVLALLLVTEVVAYAYGRRVVALNAVAAETSAEQVKRLNTDAQALRNKPVPAQPETPSRYIKENSELRQKLIEAENQIAELQKLQAQKRLSEEQRRFLIEALRPFSGQKVAVASILGDEESKVLSQDLVSVFDAAGWDHDGDTGVFAQQFPRDPIGVEVTLNENDARAGNIPAGIGALINATRQLGLVYDNTVYMGSDVPSGQALLKVGKKLRK
jgi:hypothetical protein